ncbi:MAG: hydrogenase maturation nickel metallochaperone HypA [Myxococcota bacterium]|nr:hydrogenase maturation nickel metallochaperone HypA [Myxococcota bacterium]
MHELAISEAICEQVRPHVAEGQRLVKVVVECGPLCGVVPDALQYSFSIVAQHYGFDDVCLEIEVPETSASCSACGATFTIDDAWATCPICQHAPVSAQGGRELRVKHIEVQDTVMT